MSLVQTLGFVTYGKNSNSSEFFLSRYDDISLGSLLVKEEVIDYGYSNQLLSEISNFYNLQHSSFDPTFFIIPVVENFNVFYQSILIRDIVSVNGLFLSSNRFPTQAINFSLLENFYRLTETINLFSQENDLLTYGFSYGHQLQTLTGSVDIFQIDVTGPRLVNQYPSSGSVFNDPAGDITFTLLDQEHTSIIPNSIDFSINGIAVIEDGVNVTPSGFGITTFVQQNAWTYAFAFIPTTPFNPDNLVIVSGTATDNYTPQNFAEFLYSFSVFDEEGLYAEISGVPDSFPPYIINADPYPYQIQVDPKTDIQFSIVDDHTGVDFDSIVVLVNDVMIFSGGHNINSLYASVVVASGANQVDFIIDPVSDFQFGEQVLVNIIAQDLYTISPNQLDISYYFVTTENAHLSVSGFSIATNSVWETLELSTSYGIAESGVDFKIYFMDAMDIGISESGSFIKCNEVLLPTAFINTSGNSTYEVSFNLLPNYMQDCNLQFHVVQSGTVSGTEVYRDFYHRLLWGMEMCFNPDDNLLHDTQYPIVIQGYDSGDWQSLSTLSYSFTTTPFSSNRLFAEIIGIDPPFSDLVSSLESHNPFFEYGKQMDLRLEASDNAGNKLQYTWRFGIEEKK